MQSQDVAPRPASASAEPAVDVEQAEAALVEHYPRLVRLAYLVLPPSLGRNRRVVTAHALTQRALPRGRSTAPLIPAQSTGRDGDLGYTFVRLRVVRTALEAGLPLSLRTLSKRARLPALLPQVRGLRLLPLSGGADELALDQRLSTLSGAGRAAYVLRGLERLPDTEVCRVLSAAGVSDTAAALREADTVPARYALLASPEFDPCSLQARPTDLMRRRQHTRAAVGAAAALAVCGALVLLPGGGWGPDGAAAPSYAQNPSARAALDPARLTRVAPTAWEKSARADFSVWPARGELAKDTALLRRALAVWARPGADVRVSATPGTASGGPAGPPQLLYAGAVDSARVVLLYDGLRIVRYAEPAEGTRGAALDLARVDGADRAASGALVLGRADGNVRYLTAPWVKEAAERDLMKPSAAATAVPLAGGITAPVAASATGTGACTSWNVLQLTDASGTRVLTDLGELLPARLTTGRPGAVTDASGAGALRTWSPYACSLTAMRSAGVRSVNAWAFARQPLPDGSGSAQWVCTRSETWRGDGTRVLAQFLQPGGEYGAVTAKAEDVPACGERDPRALAGVLWKSAGGHWYLLAAGDPDVTSVTASGGITATARGNLLITKAEQGARAKLRGTSADGGSVDGLG
ncbi:hypothetical protein ELQ87_28260 [Streptomyces griseoviridis]|uniref:DNA-directed RNA polymerase specialized sigma24 family protein n=1 Tax=Streptomyces griseoviridis TaxID=45398 RepID=A0A3Q9KUT9_STRGD|nr:hypothetical protein [Streptomyces griseoviridis]AZS87686.1 hypothetical protein ELQ87_28260 [Streptomyces griseoviridis]QCN90491.1 hypothetical protein DDJ31_11000 [Streptomyces griseoviridis]